jgi:hypothetical protein
LLASDSEKAYPNINPSLPPNLCQILIVQVSTGIA